MELAKPYIDVGLFTNNEEAMLRFWQHEVGLPFEETLALGGGARQERHGMNGSVLKINVAAEPVPDAPASGYRHLSIAREGLGEPQEMVDPDGNRLTLVPQGHEGVTGVRMDLGVRDARAFDDFYGRVLGLEPAGERTYRCGESLLRFTKAPDAPESAEMRGPGYRYLTIQVRDVDEAHRGFLDRGATEGRAPMTLGEIARISFVRDPDGNWIEISQRASLTGSLPPNP